MSEKLMFNGKVVIVTGAGGGLGKCYALAFAERGAKVVVNDLGGSMTGDGKGTKAADVVVNEIKANGGVAVPNYDSVEDAEKIVNTAIENFGRLDILINNAGILRDKSFLRTSDLDWDLIHRIHLRAAFLLSRSAWPYMQKNKFGRIINTASGAGIYGNFGQANYSAAKLGLLGLANTLSIEGKKYNIKCNTIAPIARSRLTQTVMPDEILDVLKPEFVAPLVVYLCHEDTEETGSLFELGGGWIGKLRWQKSSGCLVKSNGKMTPENVREKWSEITSFDKPIYHSTIGESTNHCIELASEEPSEETVKPVAKGSAKFQYDFKSAILYALSLGYTTTDETHMRFLYENHDEFAVLPMYGVIPAFGNLFDQLSAIQLPHGIKIDPAKVLHGEHYLEVFKPYSPSGVFDVRTEVVDVLDKGSGATLIINAELYNESGEKVALNQFVTFLVGSGNFGGKRDSDKQVKVNSKKFTRQPDQVKTERTTLDQAAIYRLNGDLNPLHIDPSFSAILGFDKPILHGLCSFGFAVKHILAAYCDSDVSCFKSVKVRFAKPVLPGQTIQTNMWHEKESNGYRVFFECKVVETGTVVISGAYVDLNRIKNSNSNVASERSAESKPSAAASQTLAADRIFDEISLRLKGNPGIAKKVNAVYEFHVSKGDFTKVFVADLKKGEIGVKSSGASPKPQCTVIIKDDDFVKLASGSGNPQQMFMKGQLKVKGNIMLAQKLETLFKPSSKL